MSDLIKSQLDECVVRIETNVSNARQALLDIGADLRTIRDRKLYEVDGYGTFAAFVKERLRMSPSKASRLIGAAILLPTLPEPSPVANWQWSEGAIRPLRNLPAKERREVAAAAADRANAENVAIGTAVLSEIRRRDDASMKRLANEAEQSRREQEERRANRTFDQAIREGIGEAESAVFRVERMAEQGPALSDAASRQVHALIERLAKLAPPQEAKQQRRRVVNEALPIGNGAMPILPETRV